MENNILCSYLLNNMVDETLLKKYEIKPFEHEIFQIDSDSNMVSPTKELIRTTKNKKKQLRCIHRWSTIQIILK